MAITSAWAFPQNGITSTPGMKAPAWSDFTPIADISAQRRPDVLHHLHVLISQLPLLLLSSEYAANLRAINSS